MAQQPASKKYSQEELEDTVEFNITFAKKHKTFKVRRLLLLDHLPGLGNIFRYAGIKSVTLTDVPVKIFEALMGWLRYEYCECDDPAHWLCYHSSIPGSELATENDQREYEEDEPILWHDRAECLAEHAEVAIHLYILANTYNIPRLRLDATDRLVWFLHRFSEADDYNIECPYIGAPAFVEVYDNISPDDPIRTMLCESFCEVGSGDAETLRAMPKDLLVYALEMGWEGFGRHSGRWEPCDYHGHANEEERGACKIRVRMQRGMMDD